MGIDDPSTVLLQLSMPPISLPGPPHAGIPLILLESGAPSIRLKGPRIAG